MNHEFCRELWREVQKQVKAAGYMSSDCWVYQTLTGKGWEFHGPGDYYYYLGNRADCTWSAKVEGWERFLRSTGGER